MPLQDQPIPVHFGQGIDTKTDPKLVSVGQLLQLQDAVFTQANQCNKRNGYRKLSKTIVGGGTLSSAPNMVSTFNDELVCADSGSLYAYDSSLLAWLRRGPYVPWKTQVTQLSRYNTQAHSSISCASLGNYTLFSYTTTLGSRFHQVSIIDNTTNATLLSDYVLDNDTSASVISTASLVLAGTTLAAVYVPSTVAGSRHPTISTAAISSSTVTMNAGSTINSDLVSTAGFPNIIAKGTTTGGVIAYTNPALSTLSLVTLNSAGVQVNATVVIALASFASGFQVSVDAAGNIWVYWADGNTLYYAVYGSTLGAPIVAKTALVASADIGAGVEAISVYNSSAGNQTVLYSTLATSLFPAAGTPESPWVTYKLTTTSAGTSTAPTLFMSHVVVTSDVFTIGGTAYAVLCYDSVLQGFFVTARLSDAAVIAKTLYGQVPNPVASAYASTSAAVTLPNGNILIPVGQRYPTGSFPTTASAGSPWGVSYITFNSTHKDLFKTVPANNNLVLNGSQLWAYDGYGVTELGFFTGGFIASAVAIGSGGSLSAGVYQYYTTFLWTDKVGNVFESDPSLFASVTAVGSDSVQLYVNSYSTTLKTNVKILIYRTQATGTVPQLVTTLTNTPNTLYVGYLDTASDVSISANPILYTTGGVLQNNAPPSATVLLVRLNRLYTVSDETKNEVWYTKTFASQQGINFSGDLLEDVNISSDQITALAQMDGNLVHFSPTGFSVVSGDGPNDTGQGSTLSLPQQVPADTGAIGMSSVLTIPEGVLVKTPKGIYLLDRALNFQYFGMSVERYNGQTVRSTDMGASKSQIRFLCDSGLSLVYDYVFKKWSTFSNHVGVSACMWSSTYTYLRTDGEIYVETPGYYLDETTPYGVLIQTAWLSVAGVQGFERAKQFLMLGEYANGSSLLHGIQTSMAYDFSTTFTSTSPFYFSAPTPYQYRTFLPQQKCDTLTVLIQEQVTGDSAEYVTFTDMTLLAGMKKGFNKLQAANGVG